MNIFIKIIYIIILCITHQSTPSPIAPSTGGTGLTSLTVHNLLIGNNASAVTLLAPSATPGIPLVSQGVSSNPAYTTATVAGGGTGATSFTPNALLCGGITSTAPLQSLATLGSSTTDALLSAGAGTLPTYGKVTVTAGGTGLTAATGFSGIFTGNGTSPITLVIPTPTAGIPLVSQGIAADPSFTTAVVAGGGTGLTSLATYAILCGGTTSTGNLQQVSGVGTSGQILTSAGSGALPTWTTPINILTASVSLTSAQVKTLRAIPQVIVPAAGAGIMIHILSIAVKMNYGGTNVFVATAGQTLRLGYVDISGTTINTTSLSNAGIVNSLSQIKLSEAQNISTGVVSTNIENQDVVIYNSSATEISGNAANDNTITITVTYELLTL